MTTFLLVSVLAGAIVNSHSLTAPDENVLYGDTLANFSVLASSSELDSEDGGGQVTIHAIKEDLWVYGNILVTAGSALYTIYPDGKAEIVAGHLSESGYADEYGPAARFNETAGFVQLRDRASVLIADRLNHCIRKLDRRTGLVETYAGTCDTLQSSNATDKSGNWEVFEDPTTLHFDSKTNTVYLLDGSRRIISKNLDFNLTWLDERFANDIYDFVFDPYTTSFTVLYGGAIMNTSRSGHDRFFPNVYMFEEQPQALSLSGEVLLIAAGGPYYGFVKVVDIGRNDKEMVGVCRGFGRIRSCRRIGYASAVALIRGDIYVGVRLSDRPSTAVIHKVSFRLPDKVSEETGSDEMASGETDGSDKGYNNGGASYGDDIDDEDCYLCYYRFKDAYFTSAVLMLCIAMVSVYIVCVGFRLSVNSHRRRRQVVEDEVVAPSALSAAKTAEVSSPPAYPYVMPQLFDGSPYVYCSPPAYTSSKEGPAPVHTSSNTHSQPPQKSVDGFPIKTDRKEEAHKMVEPCDCGTTENVKGDWDDSGDVSAERERVYRESMDGGGMFNASGDKDPLL